MTPLTTRQLEILRHALGLDKGTRAFRNAYVASYGTEDFKHCTQLIDMGLLEEVIDARTSYAWTFRVTEAGKQAVQRESGT
jgi:hypothetical protein